MLSMNYIKMNVDQHLAHIATEMIYYPIGELNSNSNPFSAIITSCNCHSQKLCECTKCHSARILRPHFHSLMKMVKSILRKQKLQLVIKNLKIILQDSVAVKKKQQTLTTQEALFFSQASASIIKNYIPPLHPFPLSMDEYEKATSRGYIRKYPDHSERFSKTPVLRDALYDLHMYRDDTFENTGIARFTYAQPDEPESMLIAFIDDMRRIEELYKSGTYSKKTPHQQLMEYASHLDELAPEIKALLAPAWCEYFSEYHKVEDYCSPRL